MPNITPIQSDFSVGEVSPDVNYRSTLESRNRGVKTLTNFVADARGPVIRRKGFRFLGKIGEAVEFSLSMCPSDVTWAPIESFGGPNFDSRIGHKLAVSRDMSYVIASMSPNSSSAEKAVYVYQNGPPWALKQTILSTDPPVNSGGFAGGVDVSEAANVLVIGAPYSDASGSGAGAAFVYVGSNAGGWTYSQTLVPSSVINNSRYGTGIGLSTNGQILAVGQPGFDANFIEVCRVWIYSNNGDGTFTFEQFIDEFPPNTGIVDQGFGGNIEINATGSILLICDPSDGVGSQGAVHVYDRGSPNYTLRQKIPRPTDPSIPGYSISANGPAFGGDAFLSEDVKSLMISQSNYYKPAPDNSRVGIVYSYKLNEETNEYEYCGWFDGTIDSFSLVSMDGIFDSSLKRMAVGIEEGSQGATRNGIIQIWEATPVT